MLKPVERQRVADEIVDQLRSLILTGQYPPGSKLPPERELAKTLGVNRASLREALKRLEHMGLVRIRQGDGTRVQNFMETAGIELVRYLIPLGGRQSPEVIREALELRTLVGREIARLAAERRRKDDIGHLRRLADKSKSGHFAQDDLYRIDFDFYVAMTLAAQNRIIGLLINTVRTALRDYEHLFMHLVMAQKDIHDHHTRLVDAIEAGDPDRASREVDDYMRRGAEHLIDLAKKGKVTLALE